MPHFHSSRRQCFPLKKVVTPIERTSEKRTNAIPGQYSSTDSRFLSSHLHHLLEHLRPQLVNPLIHHRFDLYPRRLRVLFPPLGDPQSRSPALACWICSLRSRLLFLAFTLSSLSWSFSCILPPLSCVQKMNRTPHQTSYLDNICNLYYIVSIRDRKAYAVRRTDGI